MSEKKRKRNRSHEAADVSSENQQEDQPAQFEPALEASTRQDNSEVDPSTLRHVGRQARDSFDQGRQQARTWFQQLQMRTRQRPIRSMVVACGVGFVVGFLW